MASDDLALVQAQHRHDNVQNHPQLVFPGSYCTPPPSTKHVVSGVDSIPKATTTCELSSSLVDHHNSNYFIHQPTPVDFRRPMFSTAPSSTGRDSHNWKSSGGASISGDVSEGEDTADDYDDEEEDADHDEEIEVQGLVPCANNAKNNNNNVRSNPTCDNTDGDQIGVPSQISAIDLKEGNVVKHIGNERSNDEMRNDVIMANADGQMYCSQYVQATRRLESNATPKNSMEIENGCGFSGRKDPIQSIDSGEKLRTILSDPVTGALMDDAMILACGHSFGSGGIQHVLRMKACYTCSHAVSDNSVSPNLSLRDAVQAFRREEELLANCAAKRRRERYEQDKGANVESSVSGHQRGRGLQFPFAVTDRVIIKGNKRTPPRFVGREAIVTTQCLNGWYVVKTLDNAESVKLQYRSLAKVPDNQSPTPMPMPMPIASKMPTNWL